MRKKDLNFIKNEDNQLNENFFKSISGNTLLFSVFFFFKSICTNLNNLIILTGNNNVINLPNQKRKFNLFSR
jgi:hypothetical protein